MAKYYTEPWHLLTNNEKFWLFLNSKLFWVTQRQSQEPTKSAIYVFEHKWRIFCGNICRNEK